jgi:membrane dipeptidase
MPAVSEFPVFDGHNDTLLDLSMPARGGRRSFWERSDKGHIDYPRAVEGGFGGGFFAVYVPADPNAAPPAGPVLNVFEGREFRMPRPLALGYSQQQTLAMTGLLFRLERESEGKLKVVLTADELEQCLKDGTMATILHFEGAEAIDPGLDALELFYRLGLRSIGPVWSRANDFATGVPFLFPHSPDIGPGLTDAGKAFVRECNRLGIMLDLSHLNEAGFWDIAGLTDAPIVATHSNVHALTPTPRNLTDKQLDAIRDSDGVVGLNFAVGFLREDGGPGADVSIAVMVRHIDYLVERLGIERVGLGSDFDGATIPAEIGDVAGLPRLLDALRATGFDDDAMRKVTHENWIRVLRKTWK